jgi:hypothetical protein
MLSEMHNIKKKTWNSIRIRYTRQNVQDITLYRHSVLNTFQVSEKLFLRKTIQGKSINIPPLQISSYLEFQFCKAFPLKH